MKRFISTWNRTSLIKRIAIGVGSGCCAWFACS